MAKDITIEQLRQHFRSRKSFSRKELYDFYTEFKPEMKETTFRWTIYNLKEKQIISSISRGLFTLSFKPVFKPNIDKVTQKIYAIIEKQFSTLKFCVWTTQIVSEFMLHLPAKHITILQVEKEALEPAYDFLNFSIEIKSPEEEIALTLKEKKSNLKASDFTDYYAKERL